MLERRPLDPLGLLTQDLSETDAFWIELWNYDLENDNQGRLL